MKPIYYLIIGVFLGLISAAVILIVAAPKSGEQAILLPVPTPPQIAVYVSGQVENEGVYFLPLNSRVLDALSAAGGTLPSADLQNINLAQMLADADKIHIPKTRPELTIGGASTSGLVNVNAAGTAELESLPGIGVTIAQKIVDYRSENGRFTRVEDLLKVSGVSATLLEKIKPFITLGQ